MKPDVIEDREKIRLLVRENVCPYCGEKTAIELGYAGGRFGQPKEEKAELVFYHCKNHACSRTNFYIGKRDYERYRNR